MERLPMIGLTLTQDFLSTPPPFFQVHTGIGDPTVKHDRSQVTVCVSSSKHKDWFPDSMERVLKVSSDAEYETLVQGLLSKPLLLTYSWKGSPPLPVKMLRRQQKTILIKFFYSLSAAEMFVTVNTAHPVIKSQLLRVIDEGRTLVRSGRKFAFRADEDCLSCLNTIAFAESADIIITNTSEFFVPYGCDPSLLCCTLCCLPCCLLTCPCYRIHRYLTTTDRTVDVQGEIQYLNWVDGVPHAQNNCQFIMLRRFVVEASSRECQRRRGCRVRINETREREREAENISRAVCHLFPVLRFIKKHS
ncbi:hypothetical protein BSL78_13523 [Apostichopus japonicus]|uniref:Uncharacterized protein n=1 Tax=Stichopus japonicus TaxID=307972 RepID=A0A2G8KNP2_STIJA|nr:hypothetical protein BSL78_13523 [Apostichopus japonicus]